MFAAGIIAAGLMAQGTPQAGGFEPRVICRDAGAGGYQAFPDVARLGNGDLLCVFYAGFGHVSLPSDRLPRGGRVCAIRSRDAGKTWEEPTLVADTPLDDRDPSVAQLPDGRLLCTFFTYAPPRIAVMTVESRDLGRTWDAQPRLVREGFACSTPVRVLPGGRLVLGVYSERQGERAFGAVLLSDDGGTTWSEPVPIGLDSGHSHDAETDVVRLGDGRLLAALRPDMCLSESTDDGRTWSPVRAGGFPGHCPYLLRTRDGILLLAHRLPDTALHWSVDDGRTWKGPVVLDRFIGAYPSLCELPDGTVLCVYYEEGERSALRSVRFRATRTGIEPVGPPPAR